MQRNIFAHTAPGVIYPEYVSLNQQDNGEITLEVRGPKKSDGACGETARVVLSRDELTELARCLTVLVTDKA